jgi:hypothetical protein
MTGLLKMAAFAVVAGLSASAFGVITITETFDDDPTARGWSGVANDDGVFNDYGFSNTDTTGSAVNPSWGSATGAGEIGGKVNRGPDSFYGVDLAQGSPIDFSTTDMFVSGVMNNPSSGSSTTLNMGWSQGFTSVVGDGGDPTSALFITWDDGVAGDLEARSATGGIDSTSGPNRPIGGPTIPFTMDWDSATGTLTVDLNGDVGTLVLGNDKNDLPDLTHWGLWGRTNHSPDNSNFIWIDDLQYTGNAPPIPEPTSLALLGLGGVALLGRRRSR